jgi:GT2 family glycosyltransferase
MAIGAPPRISVLVVNFNTRAYLERCLAALQRAPVSGGLQVLVVDNASHDGSADAVRAHFPEVDLIANPANRGYATANNQAFARATAPYLLLLNPDAAVEPEAPEQMAAFLDGHAEASAVTGNMVAPDGTAAPYLPEFTSTLNQHM